MLKAYGGRCAVSGAALEAALIDPDGPAEPANAVLLGADLRTLFELHLLRVHPLTRPPTAAKDDRPALAALQKRWSAAK